MSEFDYSAIITIEHKLNSPIPDEAKIQTANVFAQMCEPYIPFDTGTLSQSVRIEANSVIWDTPYAHYMWEGQIYGPNFPLYDEQGNIVGWRSPKVKYPTNRQIKYKVDKHSLASSHWNEAMLNARGEEFYNRISSIIGRWMKE